MLQLDASVVDTTGKSAAVFTWRQLMQDEVGEDCVWGQVLQARVWKCPVEGPQAGANEVEERPAGQGKSACQAHGLQQLLNVSRPQVVQHSHAGKLQATGDDTACNYSPCFRISSALITKKTLLFLFCAYCEATLQLQCNNQLRTAVPVHQERPCIKYSSQEKLLYELNAGIFSAL